MVDGVQECRGSSGSIQSGALMAGPLLRRYGVHLETASIRGVCLRVLQSRIALLLRQRLAKHDQVDTRLPEPFASFWHAHRAQHRAMGFFQKSLTGEQQAEIMAKTEYGPSEGGNPIHIRLLLKNVHQCHLHEKRWSVQYGT